MKTKFFSFWQHKKVLFLISLPSTPEFQRHEPLVSQCLEKLKKERVTVDKNIDSTSLSTINKYDVVIIVAHLDEDSNELVLADRHLPIHTFVDYLPEDFTGVLDFSSCYAAQWIKLIKRKCPNCHVQGASQQTVLDYRLIIYPHVIRLYRENKSLDYHEAYMTIEEKTKTIANRMIFKIPTFLASSITEPMLKAAPKLPVSANLATATISKTVNKTNMIIPIKLPMRPITSN